MSILLACLLAIPPNPGPVVVIPTNDGRYVMRYGSDGALRLWEAESGRWMRTAEAQIVRVGGRRYVVAHSYLGYLWKTEAELRLTREETGETVYRLKGLKGPLKFITPVRQTDEIVFVDGTHRVRMWNPRTGRHRALSCEAGGVLAFAVSFDGKRFAATIEARGSQALVVRALRTGRRITSVAVPKRPALPVYNAFSPDLRWFFAHWDGRLVRMSTANGRLLPGTTALEGDPADILLAPTGRHMITRSLMRSDYRSSVRLWHISLSGRSPIATVTSDAWPWSASEREIGLRLPSLPEIAFWNQAGYRLYRVPPVPDLDRLVIDLREAPGDEFLVSTRDLAAHFALRAGVGPIRSVALAQPLVTKRPEFLTKSVSANANLLVGAGPWAGAAFLWNARTGALMWEPQAVPNWGTTATITPDSKLVIVSYYRHRGTSGPVPSIQAYDVEAGEVRWRVRAPPSTHYLTCKLSPNGKRMVVFTSNHAPSLWDVDTGRKLHDLPSVRTRFAELDVVSDTTGFAQVDKGALGAFSLETGKRIWTRKLPADHLFNLSVSRDGKRIHLKTDKLLLTVSAADRRQIPTDRSDYFRSTGVGMQLDGRDCVAVGYRDYDTLNANLPPIITPPSLSVTVYALVDAKTGILYAHLYLFPATGSNGLDWLILRTDGRYTGSPGIERYLRRPVGGRMVPLSEAVQAATGNHKRLETKPSHR